jgi:hypothetical protein
MPHRLTRVCRAVLCLSLCTLAPAAILRAQDTTTTAGLKVTADSQVVELTLRDGSTLIGRVVEVTSSTLRFTTAFGTSAVPRDAVRRVRIVSSSAMHAAELWPEDPSRTRLFFAPTGRTLRRGETYFGDAYILFPTIQTGITDLVSLGGGVSIIPGLSLDEQLYYLTPKVGVLASPSLNVSVGALIAGVGRASSESPVGLGYGVATFGGADASVTTGAGFGFSRASTSQAILMLGGERRVSRSIALLSENYLYTGNGRSGLVSAGVRFMGERLAVDLAGVIVSQASTPFPYVAFIYKF